MSREPRTSRITVFVNKEEEMFLRIAAKQLGYLTLQNMMLSILKNWRDQQVPPEKRKLIESEAKKFVA